MKTGNNQERRRTPSPQLGWSGVIKKTIRLHH